MKWKLFSMMAVMSCLLTGIYLWLAGARFAAIQKQEAELQLRSAVQAVSLSVRQGLDRVEALSAKDYTEGRGQWGALQPAVGVLFFQWNGSELVDGKWWDANSLGVRPQASLLSELKNYLYRASDEGSSGNWGAFLSRGLGGKVHQVLVSRHGDQGQAIWVSLDWIQTAVDIAKSPVGQMIVADKHGQIMAHSEMEYVGTAIPKGSPMDWAQNSEEGPGLHFGAPYESKQSVVYQKLTSPDWTVMQVSKPNAVLASAQFGAKEILYIFMLLGGFLVLAGVAVSRFLPEEEPLLPESSVPVIPPALAANTSRAPTGLSPHLVATLGQELNVPLVTILGYAQSLRSGTKKNTEEVAESILRESRKAKDVVDKLVGASADLGGPKLPSRLSSIIVKVLKDFEPQFISKEIKLKKSISSSTEIPLSHTAIEKALKQIVENSIQAMERCAVKELDVQIDESPDVVQVVIQDTGDGIGKENIPRVTEPFFSARKGPQNLGLGLTVAQSVFQDHEAEMKITSERGKGTAVRVIFPKQKKKIAIGGEVVTLKTEERIEIPVVAAPPGPMARVQERGLAKEAGTPADVDIDDLLQVAEDAARAPIDIDKTIVLESKGSSTMTALAPSVGSAPEARVPLGPATELAAEAEVSAVDAPLFAPPKVEKRIHQYKVPIRQMGPGLKE